jgi:hypothetical protein
LRGHPYLSTKQTFIGEKEPILFWVVPNLFLLSLYTCAGVKITGFSIRKKAGRLMDSDTASTVLFFLLFAAGTSRYGPGRHPGCGRHRLAGLRRRTDPGESL